MPRQQPRTVKVLAVRKAKQPRRRKERDVDHRPPVVKLPPTIFGFPTRLQVKLRYAAMEGLFLSSTAGSIGKQLFSCNSIFDPDRTSTGHQPLYRDTYAGIYDQYSVVSSKLTVRFLNNTASNTFNVGVNIEDDVSSSTVVDTLSEQSTAMSDFVCPQSGSHSYVTITKNWDCVKYLGIDPYASLTYKTANGANPTEEMFYTIWANEAGSNTANLLFQAVVEYDVMFTELVTPTQS